MAERGGAREAWEKPARAVLVLLLIMALAPAASAAELRLRVVEAASEETTAYVDAETGLYVIAPPTGHVEAEYGRRFLRARRAEYDPEAGVLVLEGEVQFREPGLEARAGRIDADLTEERYRMEGGVRIERSPDQGPTTLLTAARLTYRPAGGEAEAGGGVRVEEGTRWLEAASARLWEGLSRLELSGGVAGEWGDGSVEEAERVQVELETGRITLFGPAELHFLVGDAASEPNPTAAE